MKVKTERSVETERAECWESRWPVVPIYKDYRKLTLQYECKGSKAENRGASTLIGRNCDLFGKRTVWGPGPLRAGRKASSFTSSSVKWDCSSPLNIETLHINDLVVFKRAVSEVKVKMFRWSRALVWAEHCAAFRKTHFPSPGVLFPCLSRISQTASSLK